MRRHEKGSALLLELLVVSAILLTIAGIAIPAGFKMRAVERENSAGELLTRLGLAETQYAQSNLAYVPVSYLGGTLALPASCSNPFLLSGVQTQPPAGYTMVTNFTGAPPSGFCPAVTGGGTAYTIQADPTSPWNGTRHFFMNQTGVVRFTDEDREATLSDPQFVTALYSLAAGNGGGNSNASGNGVVQIWSPGLQIQQGQQFLEPTPDPASGGTISPSSNGFAGPFIALSSTNNDPAQNPSNWFYNGAAAGTPSGYPAYNPPCGPPQSGSIGSVVIFPTNAYYFPSIGITGQLISNSTSLCGTFTKLSIEEATGIPGGPNDNLPQTYPVFFGILDLPGNSAPPLIPGQDTTVNGWNGGAIWGCIQGPGAPITFTNNTFLSCSVVGGPMVVHPGDSLFLTFTGNGYLLTNPYTMLDVQFELQ